MTQLDKARQEIAENNAEIERMQNIPGYIEPLCQKCMGTGVEYRGKDPYMCTGCKGLGVIPRFAT